MNFKKFLIVAGSILGISVVTFVIMLTVTYNQVQDDKNAAYDKALNQAKSETPLVEPKSFSFYQGRHSYIVIKGIDDQDKTLYSFVPEQINDSEETDQPVPELNYVYQEEGLSEEAMLEQWSSSCEQCSLNKMTLGILNNRFVWEMIYEKGERLYFQTYRFDNGELYDSISFNQ